MFDYLNEDLVKEILARLPVKALVRFRSACQTWYSLISNPSFFVYHLSKPSSNNINNDLHIFSSWKWGSINLSTEVFNLPSDDKIAFLDLIKHAEKIKFSPFGCYPDYPDHPVYLSILHRHTWVVGCCNGLLCLKLIDRFHRDSRYILWNLSIGKCKLLPISLNMGEVRSHGFGYDSITCDYKLMRYIDNENIEVFSMNRGSWQMISSSPSLPHFSIIGTPDAVNVNGACYFLVKHLKHGQYRYYIIAFDVHEELFREIAIPESLFQQQQHYNGGKSFNIPKSLLRYDGSLLLVCLKKIHTDENLDEYVFETGFWVMKDCKVAGEWTKLFSSKFTSSASPWLLHRGNVIGFRANCEFLYSYDSESDDELDKVDDEERARCEELISYDPNAKIERSFAYGNMFYCSPYVESLALLDGVQQREMETNLQDWDKKNFCGKRKRM